MMMCGGASVEFSKVFRRSNDFYPTFLGFVCIDLIGHSLQAQSAMDRKQDMESLSGVRSRSNLQ